MKIKLLRIPLLLAILSLASIAAADVIEEIFAVVNDQLITASELKTFENIQMQRVMQQGLEGDKLKEAIVEMKKTLLRDLIDQKLITSKVKEKNYNVDGDIELIIQEIKKQNSISSDQELRDAVQSQGMNYDAWREQLKEQRKQEKFIMEEVANKIKIENADIMDFYRKNSATYTIPQEITLNSIFLDKNLNPSEPKEKMVQIMAELKPGNFVEIANRYTQLNAGENKAFLGKFKKGELQAEIEEAALKLKKGESSGWIETDKGWYLIQLVDITEPRLQEYKDVRDEIIDTLRNQAIGQKIREFVEQLKKESYIKILKEYN